jgi:hypothetical protein
VKNRKNIYTCAVGHKTVTIDVDDGVTPSQIRCPKPDCKFSAQSSFYQVEQSSELRPSHEFYRPRSMSGLSAGDINHVKSGGLLFRKIGSQKTDSW